MPVSPGRSAGRCVAARNITLICARVPSACVAWFEVHGNLAEHLAAWFSQGLIELAWLGPGAPKLGACMKDFRPR